MRKKLSPLSPTSFNPVITSQTSDSEEHSVRQNWQKKTEYINIYNIFIAPSPSKLTNSPRLQASEHIPPGYEAVSLLEALNGPLNTSSVVPPPLHSGPSHVSGALPPYSSEPHPAPARSLSPLDHSNSSQGLKLKKSGSKWVWYFYIKEIHEISWLKLIVSSKDVFNCEMFATLKQ